MSYAILKIFVRSANIYSESSIEKENLRNTFFKFEVRIVPADCLALLAVRTLAGAVTDMFGLCKYTGSTPEG